MPPPHYQEKYMPSRKTNKRRFKSSSKNMSRKATYVHLRVPTPPPSSSSKRKTDNYDPSKTTDDWMNGQYTTDIPFPSLANSFHAFKEHHYSPNLTYDGDTITYASKKETNGKWHLSPTKAYSNPESCSSVLPTLQPHSKQWWTPYLRKNYAKIG